MAHRRLLKFVCACLFLLLFIIIFNFFYYIKYTWCESATLAKTAYFTVFLSDQKDAICSHGGCYSPQVGGGGGGGGGKNIQYVCLMHYTYSADLFLINNFRW